MTEIEKNIIINDFELYIKYTKVNEFLGKLVIEPDLCKLIIQNKIYWNNLNFIFDYFGYDDALKTFKVLIANDNNNLFYNLTENEFLNVLNNCLNLIELREIIKNNENFHRLYYEYINKNPDKIILEMIIKGFRTDLKDIEKDLDEEKIFDMLKLILSELLENENLNYSDIQLLGQGEFSMVYSVGSKVIKIGIPRDTFKIDNNKRFLKPVFRREIEGSKEVLGCIEITEKVDTKNITEEDVQFIYNELRDSGYFWFDPRKENLGRLLKSNKVHYKNLDPVMSAVNYNTECIEVLEAGELVIIDNDYIYSYEEFKKLPEEEQRTFMSAVEKYELEYQNRKGSIII